MTPDRQNRIGGRVVAMLHRLATVIVLIALFSSPGNSLANGRIVKINATIRNAWAISADNHGNVYVTDTGDPEGDRNLGGVYRIAPSGAVAPIGSGFNHPEDAVIDGSGNVYVADTNNRAIKRISPGGVITTLSRSFAYPRSVAVAPNCARNCVIYVLDDERGGIRVKRLLPTGTITPLSAFRNHFVTNLAVDNAGYVFVPDPTDHAIKKISPKGLVTTFARGLDRPLGVAINGTGAVYVADISNHVIKKIKQNGMTAIVESTILAGRVAVDDRGRLYFIGAYGIYKMSP